MLQHIKQATESNRKAKVADFGKQVEDPQFLNALQSGVNRWIREIQKVGYFHHGCSKDWAQALLQPTSQTSKP